MQLIINLYKMNIQFGADKMEQLTSKFIIHFARYISERLESIGRLSINHVVVEPVDMLNSKTVIVFQDIDSSKHYRMTCGHANDMCCSNWGMKTIDTDYKKGDTVFTPHGKAIITNHPGDDCSVRVEYLRHSHPVTDFRFKDVYK